jgi:uncharacterized membrane protein YvbJ
MCNNCKKRKLEGYVYCDVCGKKVGGQEIIRTGPLTKTR